VRFAVEHHRAIENVGIAAEPVLPDCVAHDHDRRCARFLVFREKRAADRRLDAEHLEIVGRDQRPVQP
jgi:hypothetical protein